MRQPQYLTNNPRYNTGVICYTSIYMAKQKKKRDKAYKGSGAAIVRPSVTRVSAVHRNPVHQWWIERKRVVKPILITVGVVIFIAVLIFEIIRLATSL